MYNQIDEKEFKAYCVLDYTYSNLFTTDTKVIKKGDIINVILRKFETTNIDKAVSYNYVLKETNHSIRHYNNHFISIAHSRRLKIEKLLKMKD